MEGSHPYRQDGDRPIHSDETEADAIRALALRKQRLEGACLAVGVFASAVAIALSIVWIDDVQALLYRTLGIGSLIGPRVAIAAVLVGAAHLAARALVRSRRRAWIDETAARYGVPPRALEWVL